MVPTIRLYLTNNHPLAHEATVLDVHQENNRTVVILDKTSFYPQGGGQPYDIGTMESSSSIFNVEEVRFINDLVKHYGQFTNENFTLNHSVFCKIDRERRQLHNRLHSAGHVIDMAVHELNLHWIPEKGHHFPDNPYVEYNGTLENIDKEEIQHSIENTCNRLIQENHTTEIQFISKEQIKNVCHFMPSYLPSDSSIRLIVFGKHFCIPCGGTHVASLSEIKCIRIRKLKMEKGRLRISYTITD